MDLRSIHKKSKRECAIEESKIWDLKRGLAIYWRKAGKQDKVSERETSAE